MKTKTRVLLKIFIILFLVVCLLMVFLKVILPKLQSNNINQEEKTTFVFKADSDMITNAFQLISENIQEFTKNTINIDELQNDVQSIIAKYSGTTGIYFKDLTTNASFAIQDYPMYPASMIKVITMGAIYEQIANNTLSYEQCKQQLASMIIDSNNTSYNSLMYSLGGGSQSFQIANDFAKRIGLTSTELHHGLQPGEYYFYEYGENISKPSDIGHFFELLYEGKMVSSQASRDMLELLKRCADNQKIQLGLPQGIEFAHKTGYSTPYFHDGGIIFAPNRPYILVIFSENVQNYTSMMQEVSSYIYNHIIQLT